MTAPFPDTCENPEIFTKYKSAADVINKTLEHLIGQCVDGASVYSLCVMGDEMIEAACQKIYNKDKKMTKGVSFPTCISLNDCICHYTPSKENGTTLKNGDLVKIELGAHIDGYPVLLAHSLIVGLGNTTVSDERADLMIAAHTAADIALRLFKSENTTVDVSKGLERVLADFGLHSVKGTISFQLDRNTLGGSKYIIVDPTEEQRKSTAPQKIDQYEVFAIDVALSAGSGDFVASSEKPWIYRKTDKAHSLKARSGRALYSHIQSNFGKMAFHIRSLDPAANSKKPHNLDSNAIKLGFSELIATEMVQGYETLYDREKALVARFMFTVILLPSGPSRITHWSALPESLKSSRSLKNADLIALLKTDPRAKKRAVPNTASA